MTNGPHESASSRTPSPSYECTPDAPAAHAVGPAANLIAAGASAASSRRPIQPWETPHLLLLGQRLRSLRQQAGLTQTSLAVAAELSERSVRRLEAGDRRTRASTLARLAGALAPLLPDSTLETLLDELVELAGAALALESDFTGRVAARRARRVRRRRRSWVTQHVVLHQEVQGGVLETHWHRRRISRMRTRERVYQRLMLPDGSRVRVPLDLPAPVDRTAASVTPPR